MLEVFWQIFYKVLGLDVVSGRKGDCKALSIPARINGEKHVLPIGSSNCHEERTERSIFKGSEGAIKGMNFHQEMLMESGLCKLVLSSRMVDVILVTLGCFLGEQRN